MVVKNKILQYVNIIKMGTEKLYEYEGFLGRLHSLRNDFKERWNIWKEKNPGTFSEILKRKCFSQSGDDIHEEYSHIYRYK